MESEFEWDIWIWEENTVGVSSLKGKGGSVDCQFQSFNHGTGTVVSAPPDRSRHEKDCKAKKGED